jgi:CubicO group peptidase (beta-lactamase class C family)
MLVLVDAQTQQRLQRRLGELCGDTIPGAVAALTDGDNVIEVAHGVTNLRTRVPVTTDTVFQFGSITKVFTATLIMMLADQGALHLDAPVRTYLPDFAVAAPDVTDNVTVRHLLCHTAGFEGDDFSDTGRGDDALRRYVAGLADAAQIHPLGAMFSYCNTGFSTLGVIIEELTGTSWDAAVRSMLATPMGSSTMATLAEEVILRAHAVGHLPGPNGAKDVQVTPVFTFPRSVGPAGLIHGTAADLLAFGRLHVRDGVADDGTRLLSAASAKAMRQEQVRLDDPWPLGEAWGLGWILPTPGVIGHDGSTIGQYAFYRLHPKTGSAMALLVNGPGSRPVYDALFAEFFSPLCGVDLPRPPQPASSPPAITDPARFVGTYERREVRFEVGARDDGDLDLTMTPLGPTAALLGTPAPARLVGFDGDTLVTAEPVPGSGTHMTAHFIVPTGAQRAAWLHAGARANPRKP